jgi:hypothetical protein
MIMKSLNDYKGILPYASELFGIYQPLLGWKSRLIAKRYEGFSATIYANMATRVLATSSSSVSPHVQGTVSYSQDYAYPNTTSSSPVSPPLHVKDLALTSLAGERASDVGDLRPVDYLKTTESYIASTIDSGVARLIRRELGESPPKDWDRRINTERMTETLNQLKDILTREGALAEHPEIQEYVQTFGEISTQKMAVPQLQEFFAKETKTAGYLIFLAQHSPKTLEDLFFRTPKTALISQVTLVDPLLSFGANNYKAILSPIGIIHLYREYFFEFDSFLGPSVGHVWLSPGGTVEMIEVNTRKVFTEQTYESMTETTTKSESEVVTKDELSDAVKDENRNDIKFGFSNTASYTTPVFQDTATASLSLDNAKMNSREKTTKQMRQQSEKLSSEIKRNFKTTFRTSTEVTDTTSKRYVIQNTTKRLVNYELRRKMRKVGVQVQDIGVQLCWHTFVDDPGSQLGIAKLVHIASPADLHGLKEPDAPLMPEPEIRDKPFPIRNLHFGTIRHSKIGPGFIALTGKFELTPPKAGYIYSKTEVARVNDEDYATLRAYPQNSAEPVAPGLSNPPEVKQIPTGDAANTTEPSVRSIVIGWEQDQLRFADGHNYFWDLDVTVIWKPSQQLLKDAEANYKMAMTKLTAEKERATREAFYTAARDRIKLASKITSRPAEVLREEERTVVYRTLISQLMSVGTHQSKHVVSELVRSIFDVDKMLYFVAPEWWVPRLQHLHGSQQHLGEQPVPVVQPGFVGLGKVSPAITSENVVDWGGAKENSRDNYYITEASDPAKLGSSLGWLLQLDGDNLRNTLLNSPWVKAVIPIRIGKEQAAINWLQQAHVEGSDGLDAEYVASPGDPEELQSTPYHSVTVREALNHLIDEIQEFDRASRTAAVPNPAEPDDFSNHIAGSLPTEGVFEHGFYPLQGGVRFNQSGTEQVLVSQWTEILPTDQVAALEVRYDPKTLQIITANDVEGEEDDV